MRVVSSGEANEAFRVPSRSLTRPVDVEPVGRQTTQAANTGGSLLPITTIVLRESSGAKP
jgi:hypothetical protein